MWNHSDYSRIVRVYEVAVQNSTKCQTVFFFCSRNDPWRFFMDGWSCELHFTLRRTTQRAIFFYHTHHNSKATMLTTHRTYQRLSSWAGRSEYSKSPWSELAVPGINSPQRRIRNSTLFISIPEESAEGATLDAEEGCCSVSWKSSWDSGHLYLLVIVRSIPPLWRCVPPLVEGMLKNISMFNTKHLVEHISFTVHIGSCGPKSKWPSDPLWLFD